MKLFIVIALAVFLPFGLMGQQAVYASSWDTENFDGGPGSTINTTVDTSSSVPDIGDAGPVGYYDENMEYHSY